MQKIIKQDFWGENIQPKRKKKINVKDKGTRGEYEVRDILKEHFPSLDIERNIEQTRKGGADFICCKPFIIEVKYQEVFYLNQWWAQVVTACEPDDIPVLFYRRNRVPWRVVTLIKGVKFKSNYFTTKVIEQGIRINVSCEDFLTLMGIHNENYL